MVLGTEWLCWHWDKTYFLKMAVPHHASQRVMQSLFSHRSCDSDGRVFPFAEGICSETRCGGKNGDGPHYPSVQLWSLAAEMRQSAPDMQPSSLKGLCHCFPRKSTSWGLLLYFQMACNIFHQNITPFKIKAVLDSVVYPFYALF